MGMQVAVSGVSQDSLLFGAERKHKNCSRVLVPPKVEPVHSWILLQELSRLARLALLVPEVLVPHADRGVLQVLPGEVDEGAALALVSGRRMHVRQRQGGSPL